MDAVRSVCAKNVVFLLCLISFIEVADRAVLDASMISLEKDMGLSMVGLSFLYAGGGLAMSLFGVVWGLLADHMPRKQLLAGSCFAWGILSVLSSAARGPKMLFVSRWGQQAMLSSLGPLCQSIVADVYEPERRGTMFGRIDTGGALGGLILKPLTLAVAEKALLFGVHGWRVMLALIGFLGLLASFLIAQFMVEPGRGAGDQAAAKGPQSPKRPSCRAAMRRFARVLCIPSFLALLGQGIFGCTAMFAKTFSLVYLRRCGHSGEALGVMALFTGLAGCVAAPLNGAIPDAFGRRSPAHGRPCAAQVSVAAGALLFTAWVLAAPAVGTAVLTAVMCLEILVGGWVTPGVKNPILTEIVAADERATTSAYLGTLEGSLGGLLGPLSVGLLAEHVFHYRPRGRGEEGDGGSEDGRALGSALLWCTLLPQFMQFAVFFPMLHCTYMKDKHKEAVEIYGGVEQEDASVELSSSASPPSSPPTVLGCGEEQRHGSR